MPSVSWSDVAIAWFAMAVPLAWSARQNKLFARDWLVASARAAGQLAILGAMLAFLFQKEDWRWTAPAALTMLLVAARTALSRSRFGYRALYRDCVLSLSVALVLAMLTVRLFGQGHLLIGKTASFLPFLGILLGNSLSGLSLGLSQWLRDLKERRHEIEFWFAIGATRREALARLKIGALQTAMTAILNAMTVAGLVSIPGMLTGQLMAGGAVGDAVRFQLAILFLIALVVFVSTEISLWLTERSLFDAWDILRPDALGEIR